MPYTRPQLFELSKKVGRSWRTLQYWAAQGCDLNDPASLKAFLQAKELRKTNVQKARERRGMRQPMRTRRDSQSRGSAQNAQRHINGPFESTSNGELPPPGKRGAEHALRRLEDSEEEAHRRLQVALDRGNPIEVQAAQDFWLKCSETLRRLDLAVEVARRQEETQIPLKTAEDSMTAAAEWMRIAFTTFLSSEVQGLVGIRDVGEWKAYAMERFKGILDLTVKNSLKTRSPVPDWAGRRIRDAWNVI